jgi:hypothetical protein
MRDARVGGSDAEEPAAVENAARATTSRCLETLCKELTNMVIPFDMMELGFLFCGCVMVKSSGKDWLQFCL